MRFVGAGGDVPVDASHVVARLVGAHLGQLGSGSEHRRGVVAREQTLDPPAHTEVEGAKESGGCGAGAGGRRSHPAACRWARSMRGTGTVASTESSTRS